MLVAEVTAGQVIERGVSITPRVLAPILQGVKAQEVVPAAPRGLTLADLDAEVTASLPPEVVSKLRQAVVDKVRQRSDRLQRRQRIGKIRPFAEKPAGFSLSDLALSVRGFNVMS